MRPALAPLLLAAGLALAPLQAVHAVTTLSQPMVTSNARTVQTVTQSLTFSPTLFGGGATTQTLNLAKFTNTAIRTLTGVTISWVTAFGGDITATSGSGNTRTLRTTASYDSRLTSAGNLFGFTNAVSGTSPDYMLNGRPSSATFGVSGSGTGSFTATDLSGFIGSGSIAITNSLSNIIGTINKVSGGGGNQSLTGGSSAATLSVTYIYEALPEPGTWAMLIIGFGFIGARLRAKRALQTV